MKTQDYIELTKFKYVGNQIILTPGELDGLELTDKIEVDIFHGIENKPNSEYVIDPETWGVILLKNCVFHEDAEFKSDISIGASYQDLTLRFENCVFRSNLLIGTVSRIVIDNSRVLGSLSFNGLKPSFQISYSSISECILSKLVLHESAISHCIIRSLDISQVGTPRNGNHRLVLYGKIGKLKVTNSNMQITSYLDNIDLLTIDNELVGSEHEYEFVKTEIVTASIGPLKGREIAHTNFTGCKFGSIVCASGCESSIAFTPFVDPSGVQIGEIERLRFESNNLRSFSFVSQEISRLEFSMVNITLRQHSFLAVSWPKSKYVFSEYDNSRNYPKWEILARILKECFNHSSDRRNEQLFKAVEYNSKLKGSSHLMSRQERWVLRCNKWSNNHGTEWARCLLWILTVSVISYPIYVLCLGNSGLEWGANSIDEFGEGIRVFFSEFAVYFFEFMIPTHSFDFIEQYTGPGIRLSFVSSTVDVLIRIVNGYLIYQMIVAFRRFAK